MNPPQSATQRLFAACLDQAVLCEYGRRCDQVTWDVGNQQVAGNLVFDGKKATQPCPCGYLGDPKRACNCSPIQIERYRQRISGPLLDRIDLHVEVPSVDYKELREDSGGESSEVVRTRVEGAREIQYARFATEDGTLINASMPSRLVTRYCKLDYESEKMLEQAMDSLNFSARAYDRILKVSRTLADLDQSNDIKSAHVMEAIQYRNLDRNIF